VATFLLNLPQDRDLPVSGGLFASYNPSKSLFGRAGIGFSLRATA
jgi:hypothetical protein